MAAPHLGTFDQPRKRLCIPDLSKGCSPSRDASEHPPPLPRSRARPMTAHGSENLPLDTRPQPKSKQLWTEDTEPLPKSSSVSVDQRWNEHQRSCRSQAKIVHPKLGKSHPQEALRSQTGSPNESISGATVERKLQVSTANPNILGRHAAFQSLPVRDDNYDIIMQPETRPISQEQLVAEVKGIYAGLVMVEAKCIEVDNKQAALAQADPASQPKLNNEQWQALIALHRTLLHEHHDFFLVSQHPSASPALRRLASKYALPARMWRHGIQSFLELLRHRLPASLDHMLTFIYLAYSMMALLYETVPAFEDTWIECLGDLGRYRMAIEDDDIKDREVWTGVARHWYAKASDKAPTTGRLYHHLAVLARPNALQQLYYYSKSLCVAVPFTSVRESILTIFEPLLDGGNANGKYRLPPLDTTFIRAHGLLFTNQTGGIEKFDCTVQGFLSLLDDQIGRVTRKSMEQGYHITVAKSAAMLAFAAADDTLKGAFLTDEKHYWNPKRCFQRAQDLANSTMEVVLSRIGDPNVLPFIHVTLVFMYCMAHRPMPHPEDTFPWEPLAKMLNTLLVSYETPVKIENDNFPLPDKDDVRPLPEDFAMRGLLWAEGYFPEEWFGDDKIDGDGELEEYFEVASMTASRKERILWLAKKLSKWGGSWIARATTDDGIAFQEHDPDPRFAKTSTSPFNSLMSTFKRSYAMKWFHSLPRISKLTHLRFAMGSG